MYLSQDSSAADFLRLAEPFLVQAEAENNLLLGISLLMKPQPAKQQAAHFYRISEHEQIACAALLTHSKALLLSSASEQAVFTLAQTLHAKKTQLHLVKGPSHTVESFTQHWMKLSGQRLRAHMDENLLRLDQVNLPPAVAGWMRLAEPKDLDVVSVWFAAFSRDLQASEVMSLAEARQTVAQSIAADWIYLWETSAGPVAMAQIGFETPNSIEVHAGYTPPEFRKKGYSSMIVAELSQLMLQRGKKFCVSHTDINNPTSNKIYQGLGYKIIGATKAVFFE